MSTNSQFDPAFSAGWIVDGDEEPEYYELFTGPDAEAKSRVLLIDTFTWMACDEPDPKVGDLYWDAADYLVRFGVGKSFRRHISGVLYWRKRVSVLPSHGVHTPGSP